MSDSFEEWARSLFPDGREPAWGSLNTRSVRAAFEAGAASQAKRVEELERLLDTAAKTLRIAGVDSPQELVCHVEMAMERTAALEALVRELMGMIVRHLDGCFCDDRDGNCNPPHNPECWQCVERRAALARAKELVGK